jgi:hypothetical protein
MNVTRQAEGVGPFDFAELVQDPNDHEAPGCPVDHLTSHGPGTLTRGSARSDE